MGNFDMAEIYIAVAFYILNKLSFLLEKERVGFYREQDVTAISDFSGPILDKRRRNIKSLFENECMN